MDEFIGCIKLFGFNFAPRGWQTCQGQVLSIAQNSALFSLLGTTYGGNGQTTFALPDLQGRAAIGQGTGAGLTPRSMGQVGGAESATLTTNNMPSHTHTATATSVLHAEDKIADAQNPNNKLLASGEKIYANLDESTNRIMAPQSIVTTVTVAPTGGNQPTPTMPPFLALNYSICVEGIFPSRN